MLHGRYVGVLPSSRLPGDVHRMSRGGGCGGVESRWVGKKVVGGGQFSGCRKRQDG
jgi:hypothetical protein